MSVSLWGDVTIIRPAESTNKSLIHMFVSEDILFTDSHHHHYIITSSFNRMAWQPQINLHGTLDYQHIIIYVLLLFHCIALLICMIFWRINVIMEIKHNSRLEIKVVKWLFLWQSYQKMTVVQIRCFLNEFFSMWSDLEHKKYLVGTRSSRYCRTWFGLYSTRWKSASSNFVVAQYAH